MVTKEPDFSYTEGGGGNSRKEAFTDFERKIYGKVYIPPYSAKDVKLLFDGKCFTKIIS